MHPSSEANPLSNSWITAEKRKFQRVRLDVRLRATFRKRDSQFPAPLLHQKRATRVPIQGRLSNLSQGGLAAFLPMELPVGELVELDLTLPGAPQPLKLKAVVRNRRGFTYGMEFTDTTPAQQEIIARTCGKLDLLA